MGKRRAIRVQQGQIFEIRATSQDKIELVFYPDWLNAEPSLADRLIVEPLGRKAWEIAALTYWGTYGTVTAELKSG